ncbi:MAG: SGNH/GDSL hydrolase family protein [Rhodoferax sp.]
MKPRFLMAAIAAAALSAACGGGGNGDQSPAIKYTAVVSFGDSLSDPGAYAQGLINAKIIADTSKGGMFTVNGIAGAPGSTPVPSYNWAQLVAASAVGKPSCAARAGGFGTPPAAVTGCTNYAQGGSRVKNAKGVGNPVGAGFTGAALTEPVVTQIANYLAVNGGSFSGTELVTLLAGANDLFGATDRLTADANTAGGAALAQSLVTQLAALAPPANQLAASAAIGTAIGTEAVKPTATAQSIIGAAVVAAATHAATNGYTTTALANATAIGTAAGAAAVAAGNAYAAGTGAANAMADMAAAATDQADAIKGMIAKGAKHIVVVNIPDVSTTPMALAKDKSQQQLVLVLTSTFNATLKAALQPGGVTLPEVLLVDGFTEVQHMTANPSAFGITNVTDMACGANALSSSLVCNPGNLVAGDVSHYFYADSVHPTPYGHKLTAQVVNRALILAGWL